MEPAASGFVVVNGARVYYETQGQGYPLILLHAGIADSRMWDDQFEVFARKYRVTRYDARGYGQTEMAAGLYSNHEDLYGLMKVLGIQRAHLLGCSMGGSACIDFALAHPEMTSALILVGAGLSGFEGRGGEPEQREAMQAAYLRGDHALVAEILTRLWVDGPERGPEQVGPTIRHKVREMLMVSLATPDGLGQEQELDPPAIHQLGAIRAPTLVIYGDIDQPNILTIAGLLVGRIPGAQQAVIGGTAHVPNMEQPEEFNRLVLDFLGRL